MKELDGSIVVCGPLAPGPIKKVKKEIVKNINKITNPIIEIDNHSPVFNISFFKFKIMIILIFSNNSH
jgi:hypothetical protein